MAFCMNDAATTASNPAATEPTYSPQAVHLLRTAVQTHVTLSQIADQKAGILMTATFVVFTLAVGQASNGPFALALLVLAVFAFLTAICAIVAVIPAIPASGGQDHVNLLFFGNFSQLSEQDFLERLLPMLTSDESLFRTMIRDLHQNGQVLQRKKYRWLGYAYRLFLAGLLLAGAAVIHTVATGGARGGV